MRQSNGLTCLISAMIFLASCNKPVNDSNLSAIQSLQQRWMVDSIVSYTNINFSGVGQRLNGIKGASDFRNDNIVYTQLLGLYSGDNEDFRDTAKYDFQTDKNLIIKNIIKYGVAYKLNDTSKVIYLDNARLIIENLSALQFLPYSKIYYHR